MIKKKAPRTVSKSIASKSVLKKTPAIKEKIIKEIIIEDPVIEKIIDTKINLDEILDFNHNWQMSIEERAAACYLLSKIPNKDTAIEIGSLDGGFLKILNKNFKKTYSCDISHDRLIKSDYENVEWVLGDSKETIPELIIKINENKEKVSFVSIDGDHTYAGVLEDINNILKIIPQNDIAILMHDTWNHDVRQAICATNFNRNPYVKYINTDYCSVTSICNNTMFGGFCLILLTPEQRTEDVKIIQSNDYMFLKLLNHFN